MCGFVCTVNLKINNDLILRKFNHLKKIYQHRGPDNINFYSNERSQVLFRRLKIIELSNSANQPFVDDNFVMVYNGEVYNYLELKNDLLKKGIKFKTESDTEVVFESFKYYGINFVKKLRGMFSIVILDLKKKKTYFFRDRFGQKPLYYSRFLSGYIISSEIKDIIFLKGKAEENFKSVEKYLLRSFSDDNNQTFFKDIYSFPSSSYGVLDANNFLNIRKYWSLNFTKNLKFDKNEFDYLYNENLKIHLNSHVPVAFTLSGGLDSTSLVKYAHLNNFNVNSFSLSMNKNIGNDESLFIKKFLKSNDINHEFIKIDKKDLKNIIEKTINYYDEPSAHASKLLQFIMREKIAKKGFKVLINGEGGDEFLGGYLRHYKYFIYEQFLKGNKSVPKLFKKNCQNSTQEKFLKTIKKTNLILEGLKKDTHDIEHLDVFKFTNHNIKNLKKNLRFFIQSDLKGKNFFKKALLSQIFKRDLPYCLKFEDRNSMASSIEGRTPLVDHTLAEYIFSRKTSYFLQDGELKFMLKSILKNKIPDGHLKKKKLEDQVQKVI